MLVNEIPCHLLGHFEDTVYLVYLFSTAAWEVTFYFIYLTLSSPLCLINCVWGSTKWILGLL